MKRSAAAVLLLLVPLAAAAQQPSPHDGLNDTQKLGRQVFAQSCGVCHLPPAINARVRFMRAPPCFGAAYRQYASRSLSEC